MIIKITPDQEKAKSMLKLIKNIEEFILTIDVEKFSTIATKQYYEVIRELSSILLLLDGFKATGENAHKETIDYLSNYEEFSEDEIMLLNDLRIKRNKSSYEGKIVDKSYLQNKKNKFLEVIKKLKDLINRKLKS